MNGDDTPAVPEVAPIHTLIQALLLVIEDMVARALEDADISKDAIQALEARVADLESEVEGFGSHYHSVDTITDTAEW